MKSFFETLTTMLVMIILCMSCGGNGSVNNAGKENNANVEEETSEASNNPLDIIGFTPIYEHDEKRWYLEYITLQTSNGDYMYDDEEAEAYLDGYVSVFYMALVISSGAIWSDKGDIREYLKQNLIDVVVNLPLDSSYPEKIREYANEKYYSNKDGEIHKVSRGYGYVKYACYQKIFDKYVPTYFIASRSKDGRFILKYSLM